MTDRIGNALHRLQACIHPHVKHVITQSIDWTVLHEDSVDPQEAHILRQAITIQRGEELNGVTALFPEG
jgi:hypothetical protein